MIHIIVVSHHHDRYVIPLINKLQNQQPQSTDCFRLYIKDNVNSANLHDYCEKHGVIYFSSNEQSGFSKNNNLAVNSIVSNFEVNDDDYFLILNPDVLVDGEKIVKLSGILKIKAYDLFTVDLFKDEKLSVRDPAVRKFPKLIDFFTSYFLGYNKSIIDRENIHTHQEVDWCAGSFLGIKSSVYKEINGFDENFFMYCEDIDICFRAKKKGFKLIYIPEIKVVHFSQNDNRSFFSKNFIWHLRSIVYMYRKHMVHFLL